MLTPAAAPRQPRYHSLDLWRGVACLMVVAYHSAVHFSVASSAHGRSTASFADTLIGLTHYGQWGVPIFFVISGYCISASADASRRKNQSAGDYFYRRFRRIFPPYWIILAFSILIVGVVDWLLLPRFLSTEPRFIPRPWWLDTWQWLGNVTLTETWRHYLGGGGRIHFVGQSWTLCYEEQFYAVMGLLLLAGKQRLFTGTIIVSVLTIACCALQRTGQWSIAGLFLDGAWLQFAAGVLVYHAVNYAKSTRPAYLLIACGVGACLALPDFFGDKMLPAWCFAALLLVLHRWDARIAASSLLRPLSLCGLMCYSLYLVHGLPVDILSKLLYGYGIDTSWETLFITLPLCTSTSLVLGYAFYLHVERRFLNISSSNVTPATGSALEPAVNPVGAETTPQPIGASPVL